MSAETLVDSPPSVLYIEGFTFGAGVSLDGGVQVATLNFTFDYTSLIDDGLADFFVSYSQGTAQGITINDNTIADQLSSVGPDLNAVPIPGAVLLFGSGLLGLVGIRRRKK